ncbi:MAG TPA: hypothetical protein VFX92_14415 [Candidatus Krumholzibacteria bacterium]|nr:hypothetical protein [Candidatus Krumholzibacteria bacterium]
MFHVKHTWGGTRRRHAVGNVNFGGVQIDAIPVANHALIAAA